MIDNFSIDKSLKLLGSQRFVHQPAGFMDGVWQRAGQLGEIADRRRRAALFSGLFVIGLGSGISTIGFPSDYSSSSQITYNDFVAGDQLSPATLLNVGE